MPPENVIENNYHYAKERMEDLLNEDDFIVQPAKPLWQKLKLLYLAAPFNVAVIYGAVMYGVPAAIGRMVVIASLLTPVTLLAILIFRKGNHPHPTNKTAMKAIFAMMGCYAVTFELLSVVEFLYHKTTITHFSESSTYSIGIPMAYAILCCIIFLPILSAQRRRRSSAKTTLQK